ncbi:nucleotidyltransferase family protein [Cuneatibacter caecimuris]|uniref:Nucleotidyltransferase-like protein n=1 Tax=Cuneatibacter caecimuris TaxID=1796618 RepID=A0A4Q7PQS1_9FIRM|nr:sugar phosphate nucleotidyltransferase [Cuneatibacter caecimuris]RZT02666.1 nucleotidyltransferase-like protein [Cuneatibacter caecimuris]
MKKTTLVIMAAGIGSRFGEGIKQLTPVGPSGEIIMDYSIHDAAEAGFNKVVFIIRRDLEKDFKEIIGDRIEKKIEVDYAFQALEDLPAGFTVPEGRKKPWGTGQAVLCCRGIVDTPFLVINADDYYGKEAFVKIHDYLVQERPSTGKFDICMAGFILKNTLSDNGAVTRGVCVVEGDQLKGVHETSEIIMGPDGKVTGEYEGAVSELNPNGHVSMNMWGFTPDFLDVLEDGFTDFLKSAGKDEIKKEYLLPAVVDRLLQEGKADVKVLETHDKWFGVTYQADKQAVIDAFHGLVEKGVYPENIV